MELYNPKDCWHRPYFTITDSGVYRNTDCALTEKDYEGMCDRKGVNPIYPELVQFLDTRMNEALDGTVTYLGEIKPPKKGKPRKKIIPRPPKQPREYPKVDNVYDRIKKRREELGITI